MSKQELPDHEQLLQPACQLQDFLKQSGAQHYDIFVEQSQEFEVKVADGRIVTLQQAHNRSLGVRVLDNKRMGFASSADLTTQGLRQLAQDVVQLARLAEPVSYHDIPHIEGELSANPSSLQSMDPGLLQLSPGEKIAWARTMEAAARQESPQIRTLRDSGVSTSHRSALLLTSTGAMRSYGGTTLGMWCSPLAGSGEQQQMEYEYAVGTHLSSLPSPEHIGAQAARRALRMMGAKSMDSQRCTVIMEPRFAASWISDLVRACYGDKVSKGASFFSQHLGQSIGPAHLSITDEPHIPQGLGSSLCDGEGLATQSLPIISQGMLQHWLIDSTTARKTGWQATGHGQRSSRSLPSIAPYNLRVAPGTASLEQLIANCAQGLLITRGLGAGLNLISGDYSRGINGIWIEQGQLRYPVQEMTVAGHTWDMLKQLTAVASDVEIHGTIGCPALQIEGMTLAGQSAT